MPRPIHAGKLVTLAILLLAMGLAAFAWVYHRGRGQRAIAYWGAENALSIHHADTVSLARLRLSESPAAADVGTRIIDAHPWSLADREDLSTTPGLVHLRLALLEDRSFDWSPTAAANPTHWDHLLIFEGRGAPLEIAISLQDQRLQCLGNQHATLGLRIAEGIRQFIGEPSSTSVE